MRAQSREVSTSSAAMTHSVFLRDSAEPGNTENRVPRAPTYSRLRSSQEPTWPSSPDSSEMWMASSLAAASTGSGEMVMPSGLASWRSWVNRSCHSRTRR